MAAVMAGDSPGPVVPFGACAGAVRGPLSPEAEALACGEWCPAYLPSVVDMGAAGLSGP